MKALIFSIFFFSVGVHAHQVDVYAGPHFNYMRIKFINPSHMEGYGAGITTGVQYVHSYFRGSLDFEGTWNAGPITGEPNQRSSIYEYFLDLNVGPHFLWGCWQFSPYTGFGWDRFNNKINPSLSSRSFLYDKLFIPIGFNLHWIQKNFDLGFQFEFRPDVYKHLNLASSIDFKPKWGYGFRTEVFLKQLFPFQWGTIALNFIPFFDWNRFGNVHEENSVGATLDFPRLLCWKVGLRAIVSVEF